VQRLRTLNRPVILYNTDDPTGRRDGHRFDSLLRAVSYYDLCVTVRETTAAELLNHGARAVRHVWMSYDEIAHRPFNRLADIPAAFRSEVAFVGTWIPGENRDQFLLSLIEKGISLSIWGDAWQKSPGWDAIQPFWRGRSIYGRDYVAAIQGAKLVLGLLSKGNRDLHTTRSVEIPYAGGLLLAERTTEHLKLYKDGKEAVFWADAEECAALCEQLLNDDQLRESIRARGAQKVRAAGLGNEDVLRDILSGFFNAAPR
jgi:spore maturation protein CgeB